MLSKLVAEKCPPLVRARVQSMIEDTPVETILAELEGMRERKNRRGVLPQITVPALVVVGALDVLTPPSDAEAMQKEIPGAWLIIPLGVSHLVGREPSGARTYNGRSRPCLGPWRVARGDRVTGFRERG